MTGRRIVSLVRLLIGLLAGLLMTAGNVSAGVYRWVDENGKVHFGDRPPADAEAETLEMPEVTPSETPEVSVQERRERQRRLVEALEEEREEKERKKQEAEAQEEKREAYCRRLLAQVKDSERISRYYKYDKKGERVYMNDEDADAYRDKLRSTYDARCQSD